MNWVEKLYINQDNDWVDDKLVGRNDDWIIPHRLDIDSLGQTKAQMEEDNIDKQLHLWTSNGSGVTYNNMIYTFHGMIGWWMRTFSPLRAGAYTNRAYIYNPNSASGDVTTPNSDYRFMHIRPVPYTAYDSSACLHNREIYIMGGRTYLDGVNLNLHYKYTPATGNYTQLANMPSPRQGHATISVGNFIYVFGGGTNVLWRYSPETNSWATMANAPRSRDACCIVEYEHKIYVIGGNSGSTFWSMIDVYDVINNSWSTLPSSSNIPTPRRHLKAERTGIHIVTWGGVIDSVGVDTSVTELFRLDTLTWDTSSNNMEYPQSRGVSGVYNGKLFNLFGWRDMGDFGGVRFGSWTEKIHEFDFSLFVPSLSAPTGLVAGSISNTSLAVVWNQNLNAVHYDIEYGRTSTGALTEISNVKGKLYVIPNLVSGAQYRVRIRAKNSKFTSSYSSYFYITMPAPPETPTGLTLDTNPRFENNLKIKWNSVSGNPLYRVRLRLSPSGGWGEFTTSNPYMTLFDLSYGKIYDMQVRAENNGQESNYSNILTEGVAPKTPELAYVSKGINNIDVSTSVSAGDWDYVTVWYRVGSGSWSSTNINYPPTTKSITGLQAGTQYELKASTFRVVNGIPIESRDSSANVGYSTPLFITTGSARPNSWGLSEWGLTIQSGGNIYGISGKALFLMPASNWNLFTNRINQFRDYKGLSAYTFTNVSQNQDVTKEIINQALNAIRAMSSHFTSGNTLISNRIAGQNILEANIYINMRNCLNSIL